MLEFAATVFTFIQGSETRQNMEWNKLRGVSEHVVIRSYFVTQITQNVLSFVFKISLIGCQ